ncbi:hypothetical protein EON73_01390 [bacterium]|nr:MAG: hypothetical protein EON73_01390 [bacterium]
MKDFIELWTREDDVQSFEYTVVKSANIVAIQLVESGFKLTLVTGLVLFAMYDETSLIELELDVEIVCSTEFWKKKIPNFDKNAFLDRHLNLINNSKGTFQKTVI